MHIRIYNHFINYSFNIHLQRALKKYALNNFTLHILEFYTFNFNLSIEKNKELLITREQYYLDLLSPKYNIDPNGGSRLGAKLLLKTKQKMSEAKLGKILSEETKNKMSKAQSGSNNSNFGKILSNET
jgi:group I intron endonuclease